MLKRIISFTLTATLLIGTFVSCKVAEEDMSISSAISVASSDAAEYAEWLTDRLDTVPNEVIVGIGSDDSYGVDMENFEDDGYIIRHVDSDVAIFGKTAEGLDRGVREYANLIDLNGTVEDVTFHEGYRIDRFELFGHDISEFEIEYPVESNANMEFAVTELVRLLEFACGYAPETVKGTSDAEHKIIFRFTEDESLGDDGYRYYEEDGCLVIEGAVARGCMNGVYRFLQNECGWTGLIYGESELLESEFVSIPEGISESEVPAFEYFKPYKNRCAINQYYTDRTEIGENSAENGYGYFIHASHGMSNRKWANYNVTNYSLQICYSSEGVYETVYHNVMKYLKDREDEGHVIGTSFKNIDIAQGDSNNYCMCSGCCEILAEELSNSGAVLRFANRLAEDVNSVYSGVAIHIFAYFSTKIPPAITKAHDMVYITFAQNGNCSNHPMDGSLCRERSTPSDDYLVTDNNKDNHEWLSGWCDIAKNVTVWYYALNTVLLQYTILDVLYDDLKYMKDLGIRGVFLEAEYDDFGIKRLEHQIAVELNWNIDMTDAEYQEFLRQMLRKEYGEGVDYLLEYLDIWYEAFDRVGCTNCWGMSNSSDPLFDTFFVRDNSDRCKELMEKIISLAQSERQEIRCKLLSCHVYYQDVYTKYFQAYEVNDTELLAELEETYKFLLDRMIELGMDPNTFGNKGRRRVKPTLEEEAWTVWKAQRVKQVGSDYTRPEPEWVGKTEAVTTVVETTGAE